MNLRIPAWALWALGVVFVVAETAGLSLESRPWAGTHPYLINVLSALTGFAASGLFAALVLDRARRVRYRDVELDRRTLALTDIDALLRALVAVFAPSGYGDDPVAALSKHARDVAWSTGADGEKVADALVKAMEGSHRGLLSSDGYPDGQRLVARFGFLADSRIEYLAERLDRKTRALRLLLSELITAPRSGRSAAEAYESAAAVAAAAVDVRAWLYDAPDKSMRRAVEQRAYRSDVLD